MSGFEDTKFPSVETSEKDAAHLKERETAAPHLDETLVTAEDRTEQVAANQAQAAEDEAKAAELAGKIKNGEIGVHNNERGSGSVQESLSGKDRKRADAHRQFDRATGLLRGEAEVALSGGDISAFQAVYIKMTENKIAELRFRIQGTEEDINDGSYLESQVTFRSATPEKIRGMYEDQKRSFTQQIEMLERDSIQLVKENPQVIIDREGFDRNLEKVGVLKSILKEADGFLREEKQRGGQPGEMYPNATAKVEGAVAAALRYQDPKVMSFLKETFDGDLPMTKVVLSPGLQEQIKSLKV